MISTTLTARTISIERTVDGAMYLLRPIRPDDAERERQFICSLSPESRYRRLMYSVREPSAAFVEQMVTVDYRRTMAFVAAVGEEDEEIIIGVARYADTADGSRCEFAIAIADAWQSRGVGTAIARRLLDYAREQGVLNLSASILTTNSRMLDFARWLGFTISTMPDESTLIDASLALGPTSGRPDSIR
jgi:acetyltransferase